LGRTSGEGRAVSVPRLGEVKVTDGRGIIQTEVVSAGYDIGPATQPLPAMHPVATARPRHRRLVDAPGGR
jgi:hypothetical protein